LAVIVTTEAVTIKQTKKISKTQTSIMIENKNKQLGYGFGVWIALGSALGVAFGAAFGDIAMGLIIGTVVGLLFGLVKSKK
jgi:uncharacterized membrane protein